MFVVSAVPPTVPAGVSQNHIFPAPAQPRTLNLGTAALEISPFALASQNGPVGVGPDSVPPTTSNPPPIFHGDAGDLVSRAPLAQI